MGTKVQCKSYLSGYFSMRELDQNKSGTWPTYYEDKTSLGHLQNGFLPTTINGHLEYDRENLKRTMLEHDAIFRKQVYELHRLYKTQKDMMDELKMREFYGYPLSRNTSEADELLWQRASQNTKNIWQTPHLNYGNSYYNMASFGATGDMRCHQDILKGSRVQHDLTTSVNCKSLKADESSDSKRIMSCKRPLDLELPADAYIDDEDAEGTENVVDSLSREKTKNDSKLALGTSQSFNCSTNSWKIDLHRQSSVSTHRLADLNEPIIQTQYDGSARAASLHLHVARNNYAEVEGHQFLTRSKASLQGMHRDNLKDTNRDEGTRFNFVHSGEDIRPKYSLFKDEFVQSRSYVGSAIPDLYSEKSPMSSESSNLKLKKAREDNLPDHGKARIWFGEKANRGTENCGMVPHFADSSYCSQMPNPYAAIPQMSSLSNSSPVISSSRKSNNISHIPIAIQALPCFNGSSTTNHHSRSSTTCIQAPVDAREIWPNGDLKSTRGESSSSRNGFHHAHPLDHESASHLHPTSFRWNKTNLNPNGDHLEFRNSGIGMGLSCANGKSPLDLDLNYAIPNGNQGEDESTICQMKGDRQEPLGGIHWLRNKPPSGESVDPKKCASKVELGYPKRYPQSTHEDDASNSLTSKKIFGFPINEKIQQNLSSSSDLRAENYTNLSYSSTYMSKLAEIAPEGKVKVPSQASERGIAAKRTFVIDLEVPIVCPEEGKVVPQRKPVWLNTIDAPLQVSLSRTRESSEIQCSHDSMVKFAAETIIAFSSDSCAQLAEKTHRPPAPGTCDCLHWFAEIVSSSAASVGTKMANSDDDCSDSFETLTLKLEEIKVDESLYIPSQHGDHKDGELGAASLLLTKTRRGQARRRRQRKDFQKDILPGLATLSRHEVTEDLQTIGALMRASGRPWQPGVARRNSGRNGSGRGRGRRRTTTPAVSVVETHVSPPPAQPTTTEPEINGTSMLGWGRTRRCRRPRCPPDMQVLDSDHILWGKQAVGFF